MLLYITPFGAPCMVVDWVQVAAIAIEISAAICLGVYYGVFGEPNRLYVSDLLFTMVSYQVIVTIFVSAQILLCCMLVWRMSSGHRWWFALGAFPLLVAVAGWITLNVEYRTPDGSTSTVHIWGTFVFVAGVVLYFTYLLACIHSYILDASSDPVHTVLAVGIILLYLTTLVFISIFGWKFTHDEPEGWIYEHAAFITMVIAHVFLFAIESPDPRRLFKKKDDTDDNSGNSKKDSNLKWQFHIPRHMS